MITLWRITFLKRKFKMYNTKNIILFIILSFTALSHAEAQSVFHLIGFEADQSSFSKESYSVMYDNRDDLDFGEIYTPYFTLGVVRKDDNVSIVKQQYLIVPTSEGFKYITQAVVEEINDTTQAVEEFELEYKYRSSTAIPRLFSKKDEIRSFIHSQKPSFEDAIVINFQKISFITPNFYITEGFESEVHGGATWFNASEISELYAINPKFKSFSNQLTQYMKRQKLNPIVINAAKDIYRDEEEGIDEEYSLPWGAPINELEDIYFTFQYENNQVNTIPLVLLHGNSARSFLLAGEPFNDPSILEKLSIKQSPSITNDKLEFISPDNSTRVLIDNNKISVYDNISRKLLLEKPIEPFQKVIMSEWALNKFTDKWASEFK